MQVNRERDEGKYYPERSETVREKKVQVERKVLYTEESHAERRRKRNVKKDAKKEG